MIAFHGAQPIYHVAHVLETTDGHPYEGYDGHHYEYAQVILPERHPAGVRYVVTQVVDGADYKNQYPAEGPYIVEYVDDLVASGKFIGDQEQTPTTFGRLVDHLVFIRNLVFAAM